MPDNPLPDYSFCKGSPAFEGLSDAEIAAILATAKPLEVSGGEVLFRQGDPGGTMYVITRGRVRVLLEEDDGEQTLLNVLDRGAHFGELSMLIGSPRNATVAAVVDTELLVLSHDQFAEAVEHVPQFAVNLSRTLGRWLRGELLGRRQQVIRSVFGVVQSRDEHAALAQQMAGVFARRGTHLKVVTHRPQAWPAGQVLGELKAEQDTERLRDQIADAVTQGNRVMIDCDTATADPELLSQCEHLLWLFDNRDESVPESRLGSLVRNHERFASHSQVVWTHERGDRLPRRQAHDLPLPTADMRVQWVRGGNGPEFRDHDVARCVHCVDGLVFGLALGGGGAKGMAHLGVIEVLNREGIFFDSVAGTSAGAIMSAGYAMGKSPEVLLQLMLKEMTPPGWLRAFPKNREMFLLSQFRMGWIEPKFREHLQNVQFEELLLPASLVTVDLVTGQERIRRTGDVVSGVMESINHPIFGKPILRGDEALVDGGVLANVPSHCLRRQGANVVLAVDVTTKLSNDFCRDPKHPGRLTAPGYLRTLLRVNDVSLRSLSGIHRSGSDYVITPDTSAHTFDDFAAGRELMDRGREAAEAALPEIKERLVKVYQAIDSPSR